MAGTVGNPLRHRDLTGDQVHVDKYIGFGTAAPDNSSDYIIYMRDNGDGTSTMYVRSSLSYKFKSIVPDWANEAI